MASFPLALRKAMIPRLIHIVLLLVLSAVPILGRAAADSLTESLPLGVADWRHGRIETVGESMPSKKDFGKTADPQLVLAAARAAADRNLLETLKALRLYPDRSVGQVAEGQPAVMEKFRAMISALPTAEKAYLSDGTVQVTLRMDLYGAVSQLVLPPEIEQVEPIRPVAAPAPPASAEPGKKAQPAKKHEKVFTGLVVDARATEARPALVVQVVDEDGRPVYGPAFVSREHAVQNGMCAFNDEVEAARRDPRVQDRPLVVKGLRIQEKTGAVVISQTDAAKLRGAGEHLDFLRRCGVVFVLK